ncbi:hypothetical protein BLA29_010748 [Euroglyphus maynei]|uniref:Uncharacterized protein n=1 Tax=Euroglyphus maynei TaxID=6958 RepID=A0A1Y3BUF1_EURMA|nr:hypothetical protein BLA29_010748 [Euroglyphus maynei]
MDCNQNGYLLESCDDNDGKGGGKIIGFFYGKYHQIRTPPSSGYLSKRLKRIHLKPFNPFIEQDELNEFCILNHKNRVIIQQYDQQQQSNNNGDDISMIWIGYDHDDGDDQGKTKRFITFNKNGILVICGKVSILSTMNEESSTTLDHYDGTFYH